MGGSEQAPAPLQVLAWVSIPAEHPLDPQADLPAGRYTQASRVTPSQTLPHSASPAGQAGRVPRGLPDVARHVPSPLTSQASHCPAQAVLQHTPSTQLPEPHSLPALHPAASGFEHVPRPLALHFRPVPQVPVEQHVLSTQ